MHLLAFSRDAIINTHTHTHSHSHYVIYVVESDSRPDTSAITDTNQITLAFLASESPAQAVMGDGQTGTFEALNGGGDIPYNNRELDAGTIYFFFIRLYSSVVSHVCLCGLVSSTYRLDAELWELRLVVIRGPRGSLQRVVPKTKHLTGLEPKPFYWSIQEADIATVATVQQRTYFRAMF